MDFAELACSVFLHDAHSVAASGTLHRWNIPESRSVNAPNRAIFKIRTAA
jgi:hypothetical protein